MVSKHATGLDPVVALQVGVHHEGVAGLQQPVDFPQRVLAAAPRTEPVASRSELHFKDWLDDHLQGGLHNPVFHGRDPQRTGLAVPFGDFDALDRLRPVAAIRQAGLEFGQIPCRVLCEPCHALAVHPGRSLIARNTLPRTLQGRETDDLVDQAEPPAACDAVFQRRHHALGPDRRFHPPCAAGFPAGVVCPLLSLYGTGGTLLRHA
jgi:hypothetical protein